MVFSVGLIKKFIKIEIQLVDNNKNLLPGTIMEKTCNICGSPMDPIFSACILKKYRIQYFQCSNCRYVCTEDPYWLQESYKYSINITDTGILARNIYLSKITSCILFLFFQRNKKYLDYGGGYGILTRLMRDIGFDFYLYDPYTENLFARGFRYPDNYCGDIELITSYESFEHFSNPLEDLGIIFSISHNVFFSTEILPDPVPKPEEWWYYGLEHGQHISFYSQQTLKTIAESFGLNLYSYNNLHFFTHKKLFKPFWKLICKFGIRFIFPLIQLKMKSKTFEDMNFLLDMGDIKDENPL